jgi:hypothetical protein
VSSEYSGSLAYVFSRLLGGYDYVITHDQGTIEIVVSGKHGEAPAPVQKPVTAPGPRAVTASAPRASDASVNAKTYSTCMALFGDAADWLNAPLKQVRGWTGNLFPSNRSAKASASSGLTKQNTTKSLSSQGVRQLRRR